MKQKRGAADPLHSLRNAAFAVCCGPGPSHLLGPRVSQVLAKQGFADPAFAKAASVWKYSGLRAPGCASAAAPGPGVRDVLPAAG